MLNYVSINYHSLLNILNDLVEERQTIEQYVN